MDHNNTENIDNGLLQELQKVLSDQQYDKVRSVGASIAKGLTLAESCTISHVDIDRLNALSEKHRCVKDYLNFKQTIFKANLIRQLSNQALNGDVKLAQWFMERLYDEYNPRVRSSQKDAQIEDHPLAQGLDFVRKNGDKSPLAIKDIS